VSRQRARAAALGLAAALLATVLSGCGLTLQGVPLPGGADLGGSPYDVTVQFRDVLDLVPQSSVKVNNVSVGQVSSIDVDPQTWLADVHVALNRDVHLPANATAQLKQTTLLGEKYVELLRPTDTAPQGTLTDGAVIPVERTNRFPEVEEIFGALSMLLNGGGLGQVQSIAAELNKALSGREGDTRALLTDLNTLVGTLDGQKSSITRALDGLDKLSGKLSDQRTNLKVVLSDLQPGLQVLSDQRSQLVGLLKALDKLSGVATDVVNRSQDDLVHDLQALRPTLRELARTKDTLPKSLQILASVPFVDSALGGVKGDYLNLNLTLNVNIQDLLNVLLGALPTLPTTPLPTVGGLPGGVPALPALPTLPALPGLLSAPGTSSSDSDSDSGSSSDGPDLPGGATLPGLGGGK
jgi:phospholipid/cholesterol/gamma-HCH transport system substrate-binding protein